MTLMMITIAFIISFFAFLSLSIIEYPLKPYRVDMMDKFHQNLLANRMERTTIEWHANLNGYDLACIQSYEKARHVDQQNADPVKLMLGNHTMDDYSKHGKHLMELRKKMLSNTESDFYQA